MSKQFQLTQKRERYTALRDVITQKAKGIFSSSHKTETEEFLALNDVSFEIKQGERVGIIGRNGAGKSTLLKVLSRIYEPTKGRIEITGRLASLLEVGTGFHPELSGRENIFLNGAILGMSKQEIKNKFDEIVAFAEVEKFLDTPVKRYSSGMYVRLAFAVAAHLEPEILIVDEVLAVGDSEFQKKCLGKMKDVSNSGRTLLFVSHNMAAIQNLCERCIYLQHGQIAFEGGTTEAIANYLRCNEQQLTTDLRNFRNRQGNQSITFHQFMLLDSKEEVIGSILSGHDIQICLHFEQHVSSIKSMHIAFGVDDELGNRVCHFSTNVAANDFENIAQNAKEVRINIPHFPLNSGLYTFTIFSKVDGEIADYLINAGTFQVEAGDYFKTGRLPADGQGIFFATHSFELR